MRVVGVERLSFCAAQGIDRSRGHERKQGAGGRVSRVEREIEI